MSSSKSTDFKWGQNAHVDINLGFWVAIIFPLGPVVGTSTLSFFFFVWSLLVVMVGSKFPDIDQSNAKMLRIPIFGKFISFFILNPLKKVLGDELMEHRRFVHSLPGLLMITILMVLYLFIGSVIFWFGFQGIFDPLFNNILNFGLIRFWESFEKVPIDDVYYIQFLNLSIIAFCYGFFFHLWLDYSNVTGIRWIRFWKKPKKDGYIRTNSRNEIRAIQVFSVIPFVLVIFEILFMKSIRTLYTLFILIDLIALVLVGGLLRSEWFLIRFFLAVKCPKCDEQGKKGLQILRIGDGKEFYSCSNFFKEMKCTHKQEDIKPLSFQSHELSRSTIERVLDLLVYCLLVIGYFYPIFLILGVVLFVGLTLRIFQQKEVLKFWKQKY